MRRGDSYQIVVASPASAAANRSRRAPLLRGGKPSKINRRSVNPESSATPVAALGPGKHLDGHPGRARRRQQLATGIGDSRHAGVGRHGNQLDARALEDSGRHRSGVCFAITPNLAPGQAESL